MSSIEKANELIKIMKENPNHKVLPMVNTEVVASDDYYRWGGSIGRIATDKILNPRVEHAYEDVVSLDDERVYMYSDDFESIVDMFYDSENFDVPNNNAREAVDSLPWEDVIIINIDTPEI